MDNLGNRVNKITVTMEEYSTRISLYKTNTKLGELTNVELKLPTYKNSGLPNQSLYINYCKDYVINLLKNDGIQGFYYDEKIYNESNQSIKYGVVEFIAKSTSNVASVINEFGLDTKYTVTVDDTKTTIEQYKNKYLKNAYTELILTIGSKKLIIPVEIRSGQLCKPKEVVYQDKRMKFNITNIKTLIKIDLLT